MTTLCPWRRACAVTLVLTLSRRERKTMRRIQMFALVAALVSGIFIGQAVVSSPRLTAQAQPQVPLSGPAGQVVTGGLPLSEIQPVHRTPTTTGADIFIGVHFGRTISLGTVATNELIKVSFSTSNGITGSVTDCLVVAWLAVKAGNNGNQLQQTTLRFKGSGMKTMRVARRGEAFMVVQTQNQATVCAVVATATITGGGSV